MYIDTFQLIVKPKPAMEDLGQALDLAWEAYTREAVREAGPRAVMMVGKMGHDAIGDRVRALLGPAVEVQWMYQPQARRPAEEHTAGIGRLRSMVEAARAEPCVSASGRQQHPT